MKKRIKIGIGCTLSVLLLVGSLAIFNKELSIYWISPKQGFSLNSAPSAPNYDEEKFWVAHPRFQDYSDVQVSATEKRQSAKVDVFFVHSTSNFDAMNWNSPMAPNTGTAQFIEYMMAGQASVFSECCDVYAPLYRQAHVMSFDEGNQANGEQALALAYQDVLQAFDYFLAHYNNNRPFVLAGHSQGSSHLIRLMEERIDNTPLMEKMIAAYAIGYEFPMDKFDHSFEALKPCENANATGCVISWSTYGQKYEAMNVLHWYKEGWQRSPGKETLCVNPLSWQRNEQVISKSEHLGALPVVIDDYLKMALFNVHTGQHPQTETPLIKKYTDAQCVAGKLLIEHFPGSVLSAGVEQDTQNYHNSDITLFYGNIKQNVANRISYFLNENYQSP